MGALRLPVGVIRYEHAGRGPGERLGGASDSSTGWRASWIGAVLGVAVAARVGRPPGPLAAVGTAVLAHGFGFGFTLLATGFLGGWWRSTSAAKLTDTRYGVTRLV